MHSLDTHLTVVARIAGDLWNKGWAERNAGNLSIDVTGLVPPASGPVTRLPQPFPDLAGRSLWITATGCRMRHVALEPAAHSGVVEVTGDGAGYRVAWTGMPAETFKPASELPSHCAIHASLRRRGAPQHAVLHTHPTELIALSHVRELWDEVRLNRILWAMHPETVVIVPEGVALVDYILPGTLDQGLATAARLEDRRVALWQKHGVVAVGSTLDVAFDLVDTVNKSAQIYLACRAAGFEAEGLSDEQVEALAVAFRGWAQP
ncbi:MAG TPA: rhamnulose-1-phosphate aldolase [Vicinamibacterales bacterium]|nr:rhamnulose-1-phosphate aldolase [Vicinamibacterales bacterium]